jgi:hypothetical protein
LSVFDSTLPFEISEISVGPEPRPGTNQPQNVSLHAHAIYGCHSFYRLAKIPMHRGILLWARRCPSFYRLAKIPMRRGNLLWARPCPSLYRLVRARTLRLRCL